MTYEEIQELVSSNDLLKLAKECLGIVLTSTLKDNEISMLICSAIEDLERVNIDVENHIEANLIRNTIMLYVKSHFGDTEINKRKEYLNRYKQNLRTLQFSEEYQKKEDSNV